MSEKPNSVWLLSCNNCMTEAQLWLAKPSGCHGCDTLPIEYIRADLASEHQRAAANQALRGGENEIGFYEREFYPLSNFSAFNLKWKDRIFATSEVAYHWEKFAGHPPIQEAILYAASTHEAYVVAKLFDVRRREDWDNVKVDIMYEILWAKVKQHIYVRRKLLQTGTRQLVEDSWRDDFWGIGPNRTGQNMLGKLWMKIRDRLHTEGI